MDTERIDTETPLNINQNKSENTPHFEHQRNIIIKDGFQEQYNNEIKYESMQAFQQKGRQTTEEEQSKRSNQSSKQQQKKSQIQIQTFQKILTNESASNKSQEEQNKNKQILFQENHYSLTNEKQKTGSFSKMNDDQNKQQKETIEFLNENIKGNTSNNQNFDELTTKSRIPQKQQNDQHKIDQNENNLILIVSQESNQNKDNNILIQTRKGIHQDQNQSEDYNILDLDEIQVKQIQMPKPIIKKSVIQNIGVVKYMENNLFGKKKQQSVEKGNQQKENQIINQDMKNDVQQQILDQNGLTQNQISMRNQSQNAKNYLENNINNEFQDIQYNDKSQYLNNQDHYVKQSTTFKQERGVDKRYTQFLNTSQVSGKESKLANKKLSEKLMLKEDRQKKFITLKKITLVKRIIKIFEKFNILKRFSLVPLNYFRFFGDKASWLNFESNNNLFQKLKHKINMKKQFKQSINQDQEEKISKLVLFQDNKLVIFFKILVIICSVLQCIYIPTEIAFSNSFQPSQKFDLYFSILPSVIFVIDMYINFNLAYFQNGKLVCNRRQIATNYFFGQYWFDLISIILQILIDKSLFSLIVRIYVIQKELDRVLSTFQIQEKFYYAYRLITLAMELLLSCHILACTFILAASYSNDNWLTLNQLENQPNRIKYLNSLYYIIVTTSTIGYGDIHPVSNTEKLFLCFIGFICSGLFAYNISTISSIVNDSIKQKLDTKYFRFIFFDLFQQLQLSFYLDIKQLIFKTRKQIYCLTEYMTERQISRSIQNQILQQLYYNMRTQKKQPQVINECLKHISENLKDSLFNEYFGKILDSNKYLKRKFSKQFLQSLIPKFKEEIFSPGQILFQEGEYNERLVFVRQGGVSHYLNYSNPTPIVYEYEQGQWFGFQEFFTGGSKNCCAKSKDFTSIVYVERNDFLEVIQSFPRDKEIYFMIRDKIRYSNVTISINCNICNSMFHTIQKCPYVHYAKKKEFVIQKNNYQLISKREPLFNRRPLKYNSKKTNEQVRYQLKNFRITLLLIAEGCNLFEKQTSANDCDSIIENQQLNNINQDNEDQRFYLQLSNDNQLSDDNLLQTRQNSNLSPIKSSAKQRISINDVNQAICTDSPIFRQSLPETRETKFSKFCENINKENEQNSPFSSRITNNSFNYQEYEEQSRSTEMKEVQKSESEQQIQNEEKQYTNDLIEINHSQNNSQNEVQDDQQQEDEFQKEQQQQQNKVSFKEFDNKKNVNIFKEQNSNISKNNHFLSYENSTKKSTQLQKMKPFGMRGGKRTTFILKPQNFNSFIKVLPRNIETDYEFFQKYDGFKWENNELQVIKNEQIASQTSLIQLELGNFDPYLESQNVYNYNISKNQQKYGGVVNNINQDQQIIHHNLSVINEEKQYLDSEQAFNNLLPLNQQTTQTNEQQILLKILNQIEQMKLQQYDIRREVIRQNKPQYYQGNQRTFTFLQQKQNDQDQDQKSRNDNNANQVQIQENFFDKKSIDAIEEEENHNLVNNNINMERINSVLKDKNKNLNEQFDKQNNDQKIKVQNEPRFSFIRPNLQLPQLSKIRGSINQDQLPALSILKNRSFNYSVNQQQSEENSPVFPNYPTQQQQNQINIAKPGMIQNEIKLKDKIEFQFFIAFERQNNWKTYFPIYNLSYITERVIKNQKKKLRFEMDTPLMINNQIEEKKFSHFRRLSELVIENKGRKNTISVIKSSKQIKRYITGQEVNKN